MLNDNQHINNVFEKYYKAETQDRENKKYLHRLYKKEKIKFFIKSFVCTLATILLTIGVAYAGVAGYNVCSNIYQKSSQTDYNVTQDYSQNEEMKYTDGLYYQKIMTYDKYKECSKKWNNIIEMTEDEFVDNFVMVISVESASKQGVSVCEINSDENTMYVILDRDINKDINDDLIFTKINKSFNRENVVFKLKYNTNTYANLETLPVNYTREKALEDGCVVLNDYKMQGNSLEIWQNFFNKIKNNENSFVRIVFFDKDNTCTIRDVEYKDEVYYICTDFSRAGLEDFRTDENKIANQIGYYLKVRDIQNSIEISVEDKIGNQRPIISYKY